MLLGFCCHDFSRLLVDVLTGHFFLEASTFVPRGCRILTDVSLGAFLLLTLPGVHTLESFLYTRRDYL